MNRYDFALGRRPNIVYDPKPRKPVPDTLNEIVDHIINHLQTHMATDYMLENFPVIHHLTMYTNIRSLHLTGDLTEDMFVRRFQDFSKHMRILEKFSDKIFFLVYRKINEIVVGTCLVTGNECLSPKLNNGSFGLNVECGMGLCGKKF